MTGLIPDSENKGNIVLEIKKKSNLIFFLYKFCVHVNHMRSAPDVHLE